MASPSKLSTSQEIFTDQNPSVIASTRPDLASPPLSDGIDALFNSEKADLVEDSLTSIERKQNWGGDEATDGTPRTHRRRST